MDLGKNNIMTRDALLEFVEVADEAWHKAKYCLNFCTL